MPLEYEWEFTPEGRGRLRLRGGSGEFSLDVDRPTERLTDMAEAVCSLLDGQTSSLPEGSFHQQLFWNLTGRKYRWELRRQRWTELVIELFQTELCLDDPGSGSPARQEERVLHGECTARELAQAVLDGLVETLNQFGFVGYRNRCAYDHFPSSLLFRLWRYLLEVESPEEARIECERRTPAFREELECLRSWLEPTRGVPAAVSVPAPECSGGESQEPFRLRFELTDYGWARAWISTGGPEYYFEPGYMSHALEELSHAAVRLLWPLERRWPEEGELIEIDWEGEPPRLHWELLPLERGWADLRIYHIGDPYWVSPHGRPQPTAAEPVLQTRVSARHFGRVVLGQLEQVLLRHGLEGYRQNWLEHEFPLSDYLKLHWLVRGEPLPPWGASLARGLQAELQVLDHLDRQADAMP